MKHWYFNKLGMVFLMTGLVIALTVGAVSAAPGRQEAKVDLTPPAGSPFPEASGEARLRLEEGRFNFEAKGEGILTASDISFCVENSPDQFTIIDVDNPDDRGRWELDEDDPLDLDPPVVPSSILGEVTIRVDTDCGNPSGVILVATLS